MTVGELKAFLDNLDDDIELYIEDWNEDYAPPSELKAEYIRWVGLDGRLL